MTVPDGVNVDLYTRNGFAGPLSTVVRATYSPDFTRVEGTYRPQQLRTWALTAADDVRSLPVTVLRSHTARFDIWHRNTDMPFAMRDVWHDQLLFVSQGSGRLETDFGMLDLSPLDMVVLPRGVSYRLSHVDALRMLLVGTPELLAIDAGVTDVLSLSVDVPNPFEAGDIRSGEQELVVRHGDDLTSYFFDYDPVAVLNADGAPVVQRFNISDVEPPSSDGPVAPPPARLLYGAQSESQVFYLGSRESGRPPIHHNVDFDEVATYAGGPGTLGPVTIPGTVMWIPKGVIHHGADENQPESYVAWLFETRANLELTPAGALIADLMETAEFGVHPTAQTAGAGPTG